MSGLFTKALAASRRKPKKKKKPKPTIARAVRQVGAKATVGGRAVSRDAGARAAIPSVRAVGRTVSGSAPQVSRGARRAVVRSRMPKADREFIEAAEAAERRRRTGEVVRVPKTQASGFSQEQIDVFKERGLGEGGNPLGWLRNFGGDALDVIVGAPAIAQLGAENVAAVPIAIPALLSRAGVPGVGWAEDYQNRVIGIDKRAGQGIAADVRERYPIFFGGSWAEQGEAIKEHPGFFALDLAGGKAAIGRAPAGVARATRAVAPRSAAAGRSARRYSTLTEQARAALPVKPDNFAPGPGGLSRAPKVVRSRPDRGPEPGRSGPGETVVEIPRSYSRDFINRSFQRAVDRRSERVSRREARAESLVSRRRNDPSPSPLLRARSAVAETRTSQGKFDAHQASEALRKRDIAEARSESIFAVNTKGTIAALNQLKADRSVSKHSPPGKREKLTTEEAAVRLYLDDAIESDAPSRAGKTNIELRDLWARRVEGEQIKARKNDVQTIEARRQLEKVRQIPDELLDISGPVGSLTARQLRVRRAVEEGRRLDRISQAQAVKAGVITNKTRKAVKTRASGLTVGGQRWWQDAVRDVYRQANPKIKGLRKKAARERAAARAAKEAGDVAKAGRLYTQARRTEATAKERVAARNERVQRIKDEATEVTPELRKKREAGVELNKRLSEAKQVGTPNEIAAAVRAKDAHFKSLRKMEAEMRGFTKPRRPQLVGKRGVYIKDKIVDADNAERFSAKGMTPGKAMRSKGRLKQGAMFSMHPNLLVEQAARTTSAWTGRLSVRAFSELIDTAAYKLKGSDRWITGDRLDLMRKLDFNKVRLVNVEALKRVLNQLDELENGKWLPDENARAIFVDNLKEFENLGLSREKRGQYIAISKAAADVWTESMTSGSRFLRGADTTLNWWKGGLLALSPRWYVNNTFGLSLQYGLMAGVDIRSIWRGNRLATRRAITKRSPQAVKDTLADDLIGAKVDTLPKAIRVGFRINAKMEEFWRRAAYYNRAKKAYGDEGVRLGKLSEEQVVRAIEAMPEEMAKKIVSDVDFFIGNYRKFTKAERTIIKRVIPFWSWMRVIGRLTFVLPFKSPTRALAMATLSKAQQAGINPLDPLVDFYARGSLSFGSVKVPTWSLNPWQSLAPMIAALGDDHPLGRFIEESIGWTHPVIQLAYSQATGKDTFGQSIYTPPGTRPFGREGPTKWNPTTRRYEEQKVRLGHIESILRTLAPGQVQMVRNFSSGKRTPWGDTSTASLLLDVMRRAEGGERDESLYIPEKKGVRGRTPIAGNRFTKVVGAPVFKQNDAALVAEAKKDRERAIKESKALARQRANR